MFSRQPLTQQQLRQLFVLNEIVDESFEYLVKNVTTVDSLSPTTGAPLTQNGQDELVSYTSIAAFDEKNESNSVRVFFIK